MQAWSFLEHRPPSSSSLSRCCLTFHCRRHCTNHCCCRCCRHAFHHRRHCCRRVAVVPSIAITIATTIAAVTAASPLRIPSNVKCYLLNHLLSTRILGGRCFVFLFRRLTEQPHQDNMNNPTSTPRR